MEAPAAADPRVGTLVAGRYRIVELIGEGGMGSVYRAEHAALHKRVAVKFLHTELAANKEIVARFEREAVAAAHLEHPNIVAATDYGRTADGGFFLVMEFVDGVPLRSLLRDATPLDPVRAAGVLRQIGAALTRAHGMEIVHRDLKPENIIICEREGESDVVKVIDFGIARMTGDLAGARGGTLTQMGTVFGTPHYMSPEQALGQGVDARADQYALGVIAWELLVGRPPFDAPEPIDLLHMHMGQPVPSALAAVPELPAAVDEVLAKMLAKRPGDRFASVSDAVRALDEALSPPAVSADVPAHPTTVTLPTPASPGSPGRESSASVIPPWSAVRATLRQGVDDLRARRWSASAAVVIAVAALSLVLVVRLVRPSGASVATAPRAVNTSPPESPLSGRMAAYQQIPEVAGALARAVRGDSQAALRVFHRRRMQSPNDGLAAYYLGTAEWLAGHPDAAVRSFAAALEREPDLITDPTLVHAMIEAIELPATQDFVLQTWRAGHLERSPTAVEAAAAAAIELPRGTARDLALRLAGEGTAVLSPLLRARIALRAATDCAGVRVAQAQLAAMPAAAAVEDARAVNSRRCETIVLRALCAVCGLPRE